MEATPAESGAAGWAQQQPKVSLPPAAAAASPPAAAAPAAPRPFKGVQQLQNGSFVAKAYLSHGKKKHKGSFGTAEAAARAYDEIMREHGRLVVNFPQLPGEIQAEPGVLHRATLVQHQRGLVAKPARRGPLAAAVAVPPPPPLALAGDTAAAVSSPVPLAAAPGAVLLPAPSLLPSPAAEDARRYKGVSVSSTHRFCAFGATKKDPSEHIGYFDTAQEAADAHDAHMREKTPRGVAPVVNTPLYAGEIQAVPGELDSVTRRRAFFSAAGLYPSHGAAGLPTPTPKKRKAYAGAGAGAGGYCTEDDAAAEIAAEKEEEADEADDWQPSLFVRRRLGSPAQQPATRRSPRSGSDVLKTLAQVASPAAGSPAAASPGMASLAAASPGVASPGAVSPPPLYAAPAPAPSPAQQPQASPVTPDALTLLAPAPEPPAPPAPSPLACAVPGDDVIAFLRRIDPPLRGLAAALAAAPGSGVSMRQLRALPKMHSLTAAMMNLGAFPRYRYRAVRARADLRAMSILPPQSAWPRCCTSATSATSWTS